MKKITFMLSAFLLASSFTFASKGWYSDYVKINPNSAGAAYYWIGSDPNFGTQFQDHDFGVVSTLEFTGCDMKYWSDTQDRTGGGFYYKIMSNDNSTEIVATVETVWDQAKLDGNDYQGTKNVSINLLAGLTKNTSYKLHVWAKSWGSGQGDSYLSNNSANYVATFTTDNSTELDQQSKTELQITSNYGSIDAKFNGLAQVELYTITGQLIRSANVENKFSQSVKNGVYLLRVNGETHKVVVR